MCASLVEVAFFKINLGYVKWVTFANFETLTTLNLEYK